MKLNLQIASLILLAVMATSVLAQTAPPLTATDRIKNMAGEEATWRYISGGAKLVGGAILTGVGYSIFSFRDNIGAIVMIPFGLTLMAPGVITLGWGAADLFFGSREYENQYDELKLASDTEREPQAVAYLKDKSEKDHQSRQPSFWNGFGLFSLFETPAEREYNGYQKDTGTLK
jgi:hypothetical protein